MKLQTGDFKKILESFPDLHLLLSLSLPPLTQKLLLLGVGRVVEGPSPHTLGVGL